MDKLNMESPDLSQVNIKKLSTLFPACITEARGEDGKLKRVVNFDLLRQMLSDEVLEGDEAYEFTWVGKKAAIVEANRPIRKTLRPVKEDETVPTGADSTGVPYCSSGSVNWDTTQNLYIEGDNLEVLKLLQESYLGKVKMIYIDPPYNTGNDFIYRDDFAQTQEEYREESGQVDEETGDRLFRNTDTNGRFHSDWCSMVYSRLLLARNMLADDGVLFISIDDGEQANLKKLCNEIFGEENFVAQVIWQKVYSPRMDVQGFSTSHDYVLCYVKSSVESIRQEAFLQNESQFNFIDSINGKKYRRRSIRKEGSHSTRSERPNLWFALPAPDGTEVYPYKPDGTEGCWRWSMDTYIENNKQGIVEWVKTETGWQAYAKQYLDTDALKPPETLWLYQEVGHNHSAAENLKKLLEGKVFESPKPQELIQKMLKLATYFDTDDIIMDFFSGSATTAHAVMQLNAEDGGHRKFIMVQLPETCDEKSEAYKAGYKNICEIGKERIRRAAKKIAEENPDKPFDGGFRVLKLDESNTTDVFYSAGEYDQNMLTQLESNIKPDRTDLDLLFGCLLEWGLPLSMPYTSEQIEDCTVHTYNDGDLIACFDENIPETVIKEIAKRQPLRAVFRDSSFASSPAKINVGEIFKMLAPDTRVKVL